LADKLEKARDGTQDKEYDFEKTGSKGSIEQVPNGIADKGTDGQQECNPKVTAHLLGP
jgi:hypothetical protein